MGRFGYRFIAPVSQEEPLQARSAETLGPGAHAASVGPDLVQAQVSIGAKAKRRKRWILLVRAAVVVLVLLVSAYFHFRRPAKLTEKDTIVSPTSRTRRAIPCLTACSGKGFPYNWSSRLS